MKVYLVDMVMVKDIQRHHYCIGVFSTLEQALKIAKSEEELRGDNYTARVYEMELNQEYYKIPAVI